MQYFDVNQNLTTDDKMIRDAAHGFANEVMRPVAKQLDDMSAEEGGTRFPTS